MSKLKPCPFCGGEADLYREYGRRSWFISVGVEVVKHGPEPMRHGRMLMKKIFGSVGLRPRRKETGTGGK